MMSSTSAGTGREALPDRGRSNLVIVRAGDSSLHPAWLRGATDRSWDLLVSYFGDDPDRYRDRDVLRVDGKGPKWQALYRLLTDRAELLARYQYVWLPDDDIACRVRDIEGLFAAMRRHDLLLGQPSLSYGSHFSWCITLRNPMTRVRWTNFVETMVPCFHRDLLAKCLPMLAPYVSGWGLDWAWPKEAGLQARRVAIIDEVSVTHTRPVGGPNHRFLDGRGLTAYDEMAHALRTYDIEDRTTRIFEILSRGGWRLSAQSSIARFVLRAGYGAMVVGAYARRDPGRRALLRRLRSPLASPAALADYPDTILPDGTSLVSGEAAMMPHNL
jgi:hypothetical protein